MVTESFKTNVGAALTTLSGVGAANWLSIETLGVDLVQAVSMGNSFAASSIYVLAGVAGIGAIVTGLTMFDL